MPVLAFTGRDPRRADTGRAMIDRQDTDGLGATALRLAVRLAIVVAAVLAILALMDWAADRASTEQGSGLMLGVLAGLLLAYALLLAVPFVPGIEIGLTLLVMKGATVAPIVYVATVLGQTAAYLAGRFLPQGWLRDILADLRLRRAAAFLDRLAPLPREERLALVSDKLAKWHLPAIPGGRYLLIAALLNIPGNAAVGGGGGIAFAAGFSRLFGTAAILLTFALAVLPVPLAVWLWGPETLGAH